MFAGIHLPFKLSALFGAAVLTSISSAAMADPIDLADGGDLKVAVASDYTNSTHFDDECALVAAGQEDNIQQGIRERKLCFKYSYTNGQAEPSELVGVVSWPDTNQVPIPAAGFPLALLSHGNSGSAMGFNSTIRPWFDNHQYQGDNGQLLASNFVTIAVEYTHAEHCSQEGNSNYDLDECGGSQINIDRAAKALDLIRSSILQDELFLPMGVGDMIDEETLFAYGNSMGGFVTIELAMVNTDLDAVAVTAAGIYTETCVPADPCEEPKAALFTQGLGGIPSIQTPVLSIHSEGDSVVSFSEANQPMIEALATNEKEYQHVVYAGANHGLFSSPNTTTGVGELVTHWFNLTAQQLSPVITTVEKQTLAANRYRIRLSGNHFNHSLCGGDACTVTVGDSLAQVLNWTNTKVLTRAELAAGQYPVWLQRPAGNIVDQVIGVEGGKRSNVGMLATP